MIAIKKPFIGLLLLCSICFSQEKEQINTVLEQWHKAAAEAKFDAYFGHMHKDAIYIGTDPTENWTISEFKGYAKPHFDKGKAWSFSTLERNIFLSETKETAWFDELLDTWMGICRGSGVLTKTNKGWKIKHYVLSIAVPNDNVNQLAELKKVFDTQLIQTLKTKK
ncbi:nuclear transport factor 2 family protein [Aquimarina sp. 2201CG1-2-11]|uniref:nuclear transport factor 2 family protein n=1 Tax=Aquimarina discodermiae TaxID=3231043 RepID=UPI003462D83A